MNELNDLDCKTFVETDLTQDELATLLSAALPATIEKGPGVRTLHTRFGVIEIRNNEDADQVRSREFPDGFLYFRFTLEVYPMPSVRHEDRVVCVRDILTQMWSHGFAAVAACDYENELPNGGGHGNRSVPWPSAEGTKKERVLRGAR
jgi:hypothetical protein